VGFIHNQFGHFGTVRDRRECEHVFEVERHYFGLFVLYILKALVGNKLWQKKIKRKNI
jgi:hypothetical protein